MSILGTFGRPWVEFDAQNKQHREWYAEFIQTNTWANCPVRFALREANGNVFTIERQIMEFYVDAEFGVLPATVKVLDKRNAQKIPQLVDF